MSRVLVFSLLGFVLVTLLGPLQGLLGMEMVVVDAPLVIVLYLAMAGRGSGLGGMRYSFTGGGIDWTGGLVGVMLGYVTDVLGGGIKGLHCLTLVLVFLLAQRAARKVYLAGAMPIMLVTLVASLFSSLVGLGVRWFVGLRPTLGSLTVVVAQALLCAAVAPLLMRLCRTLDRWLSMKPKGGWIRRPGGWRRRGSGRQGGTL